MEIPPGLKKFLDLIGVNTTRLQWRLREWESKREDAKLRKKENPSAELPDDLKFLQYKHKFCGSCGKIVDRDEKACPFCGAPVGSAAAQRALRAIGLAMPEGAIVCALFLAVCLAVYAISIMQGGGGAIMRPSGELLYRFGLMNPYFVWEGQWWRMMGFGLMHIGLIHIGFNMMALMQIGPMIEEQIGAKRMLVMITISQIFSALAILFFSKYGVAGASGWLFGLEGFGIAYFHRMGKYEARNWLAQWAAYGFIMGFMINASNLAHAGGALGGLLVGCLIDLTSARRTVMTRLWDALLYPCAGLWLYTILCLARSIKG